MNLDEQSHRYRALSHWLDTPQGRGVGLAFATLLLNFKPPSKNAACLVLGMPAKTSFQNTWCCTPCLDEKNATLIASFEQLPLMRNSVDLLVVPFMLEAFGQQTPPLDELDRVLSPMGQVVFWGINPMSLWGVALRAHRLGALGHARFLPRSPFRLKRAFLNRGYQQKRFELFHYVPPFQSEYWLQRTLFLNQVGKLMPILPAGFYCLVMQKYEAAPLNPARSASTDAVFLPS